MSEWKERYYNSIYLVDCIRTLMNWFDEEWIKEMNQMFYHETKVAFLEPMNKLIYWFMNWVKEMISGHKSHISFSISFHSLKSNTFDLKN